MVKRKNIISHKRNIHKNDKAKKFILMIVMAGLMIISLFSIALYNTQTTTDIEEQGLTFKPIVNGEQTYWSTQIQDKEVFFYFLPSQLTAIPADTQKIEEYSALYELPLALDASQEATNLEVLEVTKFFIANDRELFGNQWSAGVVGEVSNTSAFFSYDQVDCAQDQAVLLKIGNTTEVYQEQSCLVIQGSNELALLQATEKYRYEALRAYYQ